jgi:hypothetical protein
MGRTHEVMTIQDEIPDFFSKSHQDLKTKPYSRKQVLNMMLNINVTQNRTRNRRKRIILDGLMNDLITLL